MPKVSYLLMIVGWLIFIASLILPRLIFKQPISTIATIPTIVTNATNADIVNAIYSLKDTIYTATAIGVGILITVIGIQICVIVAAIAMK